MYGKNCDAELLNYAMVMFTHSLKSLDSIPPTQDALFQHTKHALLAAAFIWKQSLSKIPKIPKPSDWGWEWITRNNQCLPFWTDMADVSHACSLLLHCGCVVACRGNCKCHRTGLRCSTLCKCEGGCTNNDNKAIRDGKYLALHTFQCLATFPPLRSRGGQERMGPRPPPWVPLLKSYGSSILSTSLGSKTVNNTSSLGLGGTKT